MTPTRPRVSRRVKFAIMFCAGLLTGLIAATLKENVAHAFSNHAAGPPVLVKCF